MGAARMGHFGLLQKIGEGGMGVVYKARDTRLERVVAIKLLPESRATDAERRSRFIHEAKAASALNHPNIVAIHEVGEQDGRTFMVMEFVDGKQLNELIPRKGMRLTEALRVAVQVADALTAAHAVGIVHRDLKPGNIMVDAQGRVKVLDFGLAKVAAPAVALTADEETRTATLTEEGAIVGSVPYMSPEQAEGRPVDARSDIFSFGAVLYEMVTGQRAFRGETRVSTLVAVVEKEPQPVSETGAEVPPELERLIARCLRKEVNRRCQHMSDVKVALEELRDESESGKLMRPAAAAPAGRRWLWPAMGVVIALGAVAWAYLQQRGGTQSQGPDLVRVSPDDGHSYVGPSISPDGKFVAYASDRSGKMELWLQQVGGGDPIQLTHSSAPVQSAQFFQDGMRILYLTQGSIEVIPTLGGQPRVLRNGSVDSPILSPDGRQIAYFEFAQSEFHLMLMPSEGGPARELAAWSRTKYKDARHVVWTSDSRWLISVGAKQPGAQNADEWEWLALPVDGGNPIPTGAGDALRAAGLGASVPTLVLGNRILFSGWKGERWNVWQIGLPPGSWRVTRAPRQLTFATENVLVLGVSSAGATVSVVKSSADLYLLPLDSRSGQAAGATRRLTHDGRYKVMAHVGGEPRMAYFYTWDFSGPKLPRNVYALDLDSLAQTLVTRNDGAPEVIVSRDGRQIAYSVPEGDSYSIRVGDAGADPGTARVVCKSCGLPRRFSPDGRFLLYSPEVQSKPGPSTRKLTVRLLELASGGDRPWLEHPTESVLADSFGEDGAWFDVGVGRPDNRYIVPWREEPVPVSEWLEAPTRSADWEPAPSRNSFYIVQDRKLMGAQFDSKTRTFGQPFEVKFPPGSAVQWKPDDPWLIRGPGLVFTRQEPHGSVWLMKLPE